MKNNSQLHITLDTELLFLLKKEANDQEISLAELARQKLRENYKFEKIEWMLKKIMEKNEQTN